MATHLWKTIESESCGSRYLLGLLVRHGAELVQATKLEVKVGTLRAALAAADVTPEDIAWITKELAAYADVDDESQADAYDVW